MTAAIKPYQSILITGVSTISGTTDGTGVWNTGIDIAAIITAAGDTLPSVANGIIIRMINKNASSARFLGVRTNGKTNAELQKSFIAGDQDERIIPFPQDAFGVRTSALLDFYAQEIGATGAEFRIIGAVVGAVFSDIDGTRATIASTSTALLSRTLSTVTANSTVIFNATAFKWRPTGGSSELTNNVNGQGLLQVDSAKAVDCRSSAATTIVGYFPDGVTWNSGLGVTETYTADSAFHTASQTYPTKSMAYIVIDKSQTTTRYDARQTGSSYSSLPSAAGSTQSSSIFAPLDSNGSFDYLAETGATGTMRVWAAFNKYSSASIVSVSSFVEGASSTVVFSEAFTPTNFYLNASQNAAPAVSSSPTGGSGTTWTFNVPALTDGVAGQMLGADTLTAYDGSFTTANFAGTYSKTNYSNVILFNLYTPGSITQGFSPAAADGDQIAYNPTLGTLDTEGVYTSTYTGTQVMWHYSQSDFKWRSYNVVTVLGVIVDISTTRLWFGFGFGF